MNQIVQSIYRVLPDRNRLVSSRAEEMSQLHALGLDLLRNLPGKAYWALLREAELPLVSLFRVAEGEESTQPIPQEILERPQVQHSAQRLWQSLTPLLDREESGPRAFWVLIAKDPVTEVGPPTFKMPGESLMETQEMSPDDLISQLSTRFQKTVPELPEQLKDRVDLLSRVLESADAAQGPHWEDFYRGVASALGLQFGGELAERLAPAPAPPSSLASSRPASSREEEGSKEDAALEAALTVDPLVVEIATPLAVLVNPDNGSSLFNRVGRIRRSLIHELGLVLPSVRFRDHPDLGSNGYRIKVRDLEVGRGEVYPRKELVVGPERVLEKLQGLRTIEPTYSYPAMWIDPTLRQQAQALGGVVFDPVTVVTFHFTEVVRRHAHVLLTLEEACKLLHRRDNHLLLSALQRRGVDEVLLWQVLRELLEERVCIRDMIMILQSVLESPQSPLETLVDRARMALSRQITLSLAGEGEPLAAVVLTPEQEFQLCSGQVESLLRTLCSQQEGFEQIHKRPVFVTSQACRRRLRDLLRTRIPSAEVLSRAELLPTVSLVPPPSTGGTL